MSTVTIQPRCLFAARWVVPIDALPLENAVLSVTDGRISGVTSRRHQIVDVDFGNAILLPGLVNAHTHLDLGSCTVPPEPDFVSWLKGVIQFRRIDADPEVAIIQGIEESTRHGVTLLGDISCQGRSLPLLAKAPMRSVVFAELLGLTSERADGTRSWADTWLNGLDTHEHTRPGLSPHAPYSVHRILFDYAAQQARSRCLPIAIHLAESAPEMDLLLRRQGDMIPFLKDLGVWQPEALIHGVDDLISQFRDVARTLWIHANFIDDATHLPGTVVYCPRTHAAFKHPPHLFRSMLSRGISVALGTDSRASNPDLSILGEMRFLYQRHPDLAREILAMGTMNGASALGWDSDAGSLTAGKSADFIVLPCDGPRDPHEAILDSDSKILAVYFQGQCVWSAEKGYRHSTV